MFDISWSELLILAVVTLIFVGPKELPKFLSTVGRYIGAVRRHANEFRQIFDQAMREAELDQMRAQVESVREDVQQTIRGVKQDASQPAATPPIAVAAAPPVSAVATSDAMEAQAPPIMVESEGSDQAAQTHTPPREGQV